MADEALPDAGTEFGQRVRRRLRDEQVIWITTVAHDGTPQPNPVSFVLQDDDSVLVYNMRGAKRLSNVADRPRVSLHFDGDGAGGDVIVFVGFAGRADNAPPPHENPAFLAKYGATLLQVSENAEAFGKKFAVPLRVEITRTRGR